MASTTAIEIGLDSCLLAGIRQGPADTADIRALRTISTAEWPSSEAARTELLRSIRRDEHLPRRAVIVAWGLPERGDEAAARAAVQFVEAAGFTIEAVVSPPQALAKVAGTRRRHGLTDATVWTSLNTDGAAIAVVRGRELLFARTFKWTFKPGLTETKAQLLQRYSLVAHLAPEVRHGIDVVRASHGVAVDGVVTCGNLPELRSLTMPLIEELDLEVETLDSTDGFRASGKVSAERLMEAAPAVRLACAVALGSLSMPLSVLNGVTFMQEEPSPVMRTAAAVALIGALVWGAFSFRTVWQPASVKPVPVAQRDRPVRPLEQRSATPSAKPDRVPAAAPEAPNEPTPVSTVLSVRTDPKTGQRPAAAEPPALPRSAPSSPPGAVEGQHSGRAQVQSEAVRQQTGQPTATRQAPLAEPLPQVDSILIDQERRLAVIDGAVASIGDPVGPRTVVGIERDGVLLREPSGLVVRASLRSRRKS